MQNDLKNQVFDFYEKNKKINSPLFWFVKLTPQWLWHLENKDKNHKRWEKESAVRMKCFLYIHDIIKKSHLYQEYKQEYEDVLIKRNGRKIKEKKIVQYFGLVWIIKNIGWTLIRIKVILKKVPDRRSVEFVSVIPARSIKWYNRLYIEDE